MTDLQQFHADANAFLQSLGLPAEIFAPQQDALGIEVDERFSVRFCVEPSGAYLFQGDWQDNVDPEGAHGDWLMANQICPGALQPVMALDDRGRLTCWMRLANSVATDELVEAFDMLVDRMDQLTPSLNN
jgi:hypothetical protein